MGQTRPGGEIELEENLRRKDLTEYERSRNLTELANTVTQTLGTEEADLSRIIPQKAGRGRPRKVASKDRIAERVGVDRGTINNAQTHVETADQWVCGLAPGVRHASSPGPRR